MSTISSSVYGRAEKMGKNTRGHAATALTKCVLLKMWGDDNCRLWYSK